MIDRHGRHIRSAIVTEDAICTDCPGDDLMTVRAAYKHHAATGHTIRIQRIRITEVSRP